MNHSDKIAADQTSLGFEFQDLVYIEKLIELRQGQTLGLETHDDIHVETAAEDSSIEELLLIQVKHSVDPGNVTDRDIDLWKTIHNWLKVIPDLPSARRHRFQLYTNKKLNNQTFVSLLKEPHQNVLLILEHIRSTNIEITEAESKKGAEDPPNPLAKYVSSVAGMCDDALTFLFRNFEFHSDTSSIIARISAALQRLSVPSTRLDETRMHVIGAFKESKFSRILGKSKVIIGFDEFRTEMGFDRIIRSARADPADFDRFIDVYYSYQRPDTLSFTDSHFCTQLKDIGIADDEIVDRGVEMMLGEQFMESLRDAGSFSASDNLRLENMAVSEWQLLHSQSHRVTNEDDEEAHRAASQSCYDKTMRINLRVSSTKLPRILSCGKYIKLSNQPRIGWRKNWKSRFQK